MPKIAELFETMEYGPAPEVADEARAWIEERGPRFGHYFGGAWREPADGEFFATFDPSNEEPLGEIAQGSPGDVDRAVAAARAAQATWRDLGGHGRARYLYAIARHLQKHSRLFATLETLDNGKPIRESRDIDIPLVARHFYHHAGWAQLMDAELADCEPLGVAGQIIPWNFPLLMLAWKIAPALATGNTVVLKPAEFTSLTALRFAELCHEIDLPPGVVNIVTGDGHTGAAIVEHPDVDKIAFTGSTEVGRLIRETTAGTGKKISLELGGKSPFLVFDDADLDSVVEGVVDAIWFNQGQVCCAGSRILAHEGIADALADRLRARMETLRMGAPLDKGVDIGAIIAPVQLKKIESLVEEGREEGATIWQPSWSVPRDGWFYPPTLCTDVSPAARIAQVEIFGPVVVQMTFRTPAEAVALANNTRYGLAASVWTENVNLALDIASQIKAGTVWINCTNVFDAASGFGGYRESGFGREGGREGLWEYVRRHPAPAGPDPGEEESQTAKRDERGDARKKADAPARLPAVDRTAKLYIGGRQARPDGGYSLEVQDHQGRAAGEVARGNRKDARNAVEAALTTDWARTTAHLRAQILYYAGENLDARRGAFEDRLCALTGCDERAAAREVEASVRRLFTWAAWADKWDGAVHRTPFRNVTLAMPEPLGVMAVICPREPALLGFISSVIPPVALGNSVVAVASERWPLLATDFYQVLETSDVPAGVVNILTGLEEELRPTLAGHDAVDGMWYFGADDGAADVERRSASNLKRTWTKAARGPDWFGPGGEGREFLRRASQIKNIWVPYGE
ncbi:aldehyde dehydrogenase family protein [Candidatus Palauibacter soopunensis]|uniref:aldehyde dehydrogenase family protein n=1 Tax=Candidatus Palauibacter soopunensis TaxID=3056739 RepID=UPI00239E8799|nr:aldehyde dehydrogenase family protein [Candidatus Palauibacter soopunensis]MDE2880198.1 aldehyde dehydrogenase family protein [Candidatus Palauibacter soopunensis]